MAEIHVERKPRSGWVWLWVLLLLVALAVLAWLFWPDARHTATATDTNIPATGTDPTIVDSVPLPDAPPAAQPEADVAGIRSNPQQWLGREYYGAVTVAQPGPADPVIPAGLGFWIDQEGQRLFVLVEDDPARESAPITPGQQILVRGVVRDASFIPQLSGAPLSAEVDELLRAEPAFLVVNESAIELAPTGP